LSEIEMSFVSGASATTSSSLEGTVDGVAERGRDEPAEREPQQAGVVVQHVELVRAANRGDEVLHLPERVADPLAGCGVEDGLEPGLRLRVAGREQRDVVSGVDESVREQRHDPLDPPVRLGRDREPDRADDSDSHCARSRFARAKLDRAKIPEGVRFAAAASWVFMSRTPAQDRDPLARISIARRSLKASASRPLRRVCSSSA
jgi:hypothetical protein